MLIAFKLSTIITKAKVLYSCNLKIKGTLIKLKKLWAINIHKNKNVLIDNYVYQSIKEINNKCANNATINKILEHLNNSFQKHFDYFTICNSLARLLKMRIIKKDYTKDKTDEYYWSIR